MVGTIGDIIITNIEYSIIEWTCCICGENQADDIEIVGPILVEILTCRHCGIKHGFSIHGKWVPDYKSLLPINFKVIDNPELEGNLDHED